MKGLSVKRRMTRLFKLILTAALMSGMLLASGCGENSRPDSGGGDDASSGGDSAVTGERTTPLELKFGWQGSGREDDMTGYSCFAFMEYVEEKTNGMITFAQYPDGQLGNENDMLDQVLTDNLDLSALSNNVLANIWPSFSAYNMPFAFSDYESFWKTTGVGSEFANALEKTVEDSGKAHFLSTFGATFRGCQNSKHALRSADDFKGVTFRVMSGEIFTDFFRSLGASTATVSFSELYTGLQQGVVDGEDTGVAMFCDQKFYEVEKYATEFNMCLSSNALVISNGCWNQLTDAEKQIFRDAAKHAEEVNHQTVVSTSDTYDELLKSQGVEYIRHDDLTAEEIQSCIDATMPVWDKYKDTIGEDLYRILQEARS